MGLAEVAFNIEGAAVEWTLGRPVLPVLHGCFSLGTVVGALLGMGLTAVRFPVGWHLAAHRLRRGGGRGVDRTGGPGGYGTGGDGPRGPGGHRRRLRHSLRGGFRGRRRAASADSWRSGGTGGWC